MSLRTFLASHPALLKLWNRGMDLFASIHWPRFQAILNGGLYYSLIEEDHDKIRDILKKNYLIILTRRKCHLTTYLIALIAYLKTHQKSYYCHALMNVEGDITNNMDYKLIEATQQGVHFSTFMQVFDCDSVVLLKPKDVPLEEWTAVLDAVKLELGEPYDTLFDITNNKAVSCVEMVYQGLQKLPDYANRFPDLTKLIEEAGNDLTPQMLYVCRDLEVVFEARR